VPPPPHDAGWLGARGAGPALRLVLGLAAVVSLLVLAAPLAARVGAGTAALRFLDEFLTPDGRPLGWWRPARPPRREAVRLDGGGVADLWRPAGGSPPYLGVVLVHGLTPDGKDDARLVDAAIFLTRGGLAVLVPDLPAMRAQRLSPDDSAVVASAIRWLGADRRVRGTALAVVAVSVGTAPAVSALADATPGARVRLLATLGGHAEARELVRYFTTGAWGFGSESGRARHDPSQAAAFLALNLDIVRDPADRAAVAAALAGRPLATAGPEAQAVLAVLTNRDPARVDALLAALPPETQARLDALSPARRVRQLPGRLLIVHGRDDPAIPFTESLRLAAAADPARSRLVAVDLLRHVEGRLPAWRQVRDLVDLWSGVYELFRG
jgi:fermentation-respiration switch protein FrsA (DUF1100 family)